MNVFKLFSFYQDEIFVLLVQDKMDVVLKVGEKFVVGVLLLWRIQKQNYYNQCGYRMRFQVGWGVLGILGGNGVEFSLQLVFFNSFRILQIFFVFIVWRGSWVFEEGWECYRGFDRYTVVFSCRVREMCFYCCWEF